MHSAMHRQIHAIPVMSHSIYHLYHVLVVSIKCSRRRSFDSIPLEELVGSIAQSAIKGSFMLNKQPTMVAMTF